MTTSACPKCRDEVTLPPGAPRGAQVRCPWCREEFELSEVLDRMPPMLEIVRSPYTAGEERREFPSEAVDEEFRIAGDNGRTSPGGFDFSGGGAATAAPTVAPRPRTKTATAARPRRKEKSAVAEIVKVVLGGVVGLVLAQLILWWLPGDLSRDVVELGPTVGEYVPWIVPEKYRARSSSAGGVEEESSRAQENAAGGGHLVAGNGRSRDTAGGLSPGPVGGPPAGAGRTLPPLDFGKPEAEEDPLPTPGGDAPADPLEIPEPDLSLNPGAGISLDPLTLAPSQSAPVEPPKNPFDKPPPTEPSPTPEPGGPPAPVEPSSPTPEKTTEPPPALDKAPAEADADVFVGVSDAPMYVKNEVDAALAKASAAQEAVRAAEGGDAAAAEQQFYTALTELAEKLTYADGNDPKIDDAAQQAKDLVAQGNPRERAKLLMAHGPARLGAKKEDRPNDGIVLFGRIQAVEKKGPLFETRLEMPGAAVIPLFSKSDPQLDTGTTVIVLGTLVDQPARRLAGYEGGLPSVVWMSHAASLSR
jgi:hypothetical protein